MGPGTNSTPMLRFREPSSGPSGVPSIALCMDTSFRPEDDKRGRRVGRAAWSSEATSELSLRCRSFRLARPPAGGVFLMLDGPAGRGSRERLSSGFLAWLPSDAWRRALLLLPRVVAIFGRGQAI